MTVAMVQGLHPEALQEMLDLRDDKGDIDPAALVKKARSETSALHGYFEWDNAKAASRWRLEQADALIRRVTYRIDSATPTKVRAFVSVVEGTERKYVDTMRASADSVLRDQVRKQILRDLAAVRVKASMFDEFAAVVDAIDSVIINDG